MWRSDGVSNPAPQRESPSPMDNGVSNPLPRAAQSPRSDEVSNRASPLEAQSPRQGPDAIPITPDGRYMVVRGRLWRRSNPHLDPEVRQLLVGALMETRRAVGATRRGGDPEALRIAGQQVDAAKRALGERRTV